MHGQIKTTAPMVARMMSCHLRMEVMLTDEGVGLAMSGYSSKEHVRFRQARVMAVTSWRSYPEMSSYCLHRHIAVWLLMEDWL